MRTVYDYKDIRQLDKSTIARDLENGLIITATADLATAMSFYYQNYIILDVHKLIDLLVHEWEETSKDLKNYIWLRNSLEEYIFDYEIDDKMATSLRRNACDMWNAIKLLIEADVYPDDIPDGISEQVMCFKEVWKKTEKNNSKIMEFRTKMTFYISKGIGIRNIVSDYFIGQKIFLIGFYFITPIQQRIFEGLESAGYELNYLNAYNMAYPIAHEIWEVTFGDEYAGKRTTDVQPDILLVNSFGEAIESNCKNVIFEDKRYSSDFDFAKAIKGYIDRGELVYSPAAKECNDILAEIYPEMYSDRHFLSYPVGQYVYYLHMMWDGFNNRLELNQDYVAKCFATGWLVADGNNGNCYLYDLKRLEVFFKDCRTFDDWKDRIEQLKHAKEITRVFEVDSGNRFEKMLGNPFNYISAYGLKEETIEDISNLLLQLMADAEMLFGGELRTNLYTHLQKIKNLIAERADEAEIVADEKAIANELMERLDFLSSDDIECPMNTIKDAVTALIGNRFDEYEEYATETSYSGNEVKPLSLIEASMLMDYGQAIHLVMADEMTLPGPQRELPWPLSDKVIANIQCKLQESSATNRYVECMKAVIYNRPLSYRYLFYSFIGNKDEIINGEYHNRPDLSIEWINVKGNRIVAPSPYVYIMGYDTKKILQESDEELRTVIEDALLDHNMEIEDEISYPHVEDVPEEVVMDCIVCRLRYVYSYLLNKRPEYIDSLHYSRLLTQLITAFTSVAHELGINKSKEDIAAELYKLFPFFRNVERHEASDYAKRDDAYVPFVYEGYEYPKQRLYIHFLDKGLRKNLQRNYLEYRENGNTDFREEQKKCIYCPYKNTCVYQFRTMVTENED